MALMPTKISKHFGLIFCALWLATCGCESFRQSQEAYQPPTLPNNRIALDTVGLEIGIAQLDTSQTEAINRFWRALDQQELSLETRQQLDRHGLRAAVMSQRPPSDFASLVNPREVVLEELDGFQKQLYLNGKLKATDRMLVHDRILNRQGQTHSIPTSQAHPSLSWTIETPATRNSRETANEESANNVRGEFTIRTYPQGDGSVRVVVQPQIHHGDVTQKYGATAHGYKFNHSQTVVAPETLEFDVSLRSGESLVIGPTAEVTRLGQLFFGEIDPSQDESLTAAADELLAQASSNVDPESEQDRLPDPELSLPKLSIDESKFDSIIGALDIDDIDDSLRKAMGVTLQPATREKPKPLHRLLMIRVVHTQLDDLFDRQVVTDPLSTSREF